MGPTARLWADSSGFKEFLSTIDDERIRRRVATRLLDAYAGQIERLMKRKMQRRTAATAGSVKVDRPSELVRKIGPHNIIGLFLEKGTKAHRIAARKATALMLPVQAPRGGGSPFVRTFGPRGTGRLTGATRSGQVSFFRSVQHPGAKPYPFIMPTYKDSRVILELLVLKAEAEWAAAMVRKGQL